MSQDSQLTDLYANLRTLRVADGPDIVHLNTIAKVEFASSDSSPYAAVGREISGTNINIAKFGKYDHLPEDYGTWKKTPMGKLPTPKAKL